MKDPKKEKSKNPSLASIVIVLVVGMIIFNSFIGLLTGDGFFETMGNEISALVTLVNIGLVLVGLYFLFGYKK